jgi:hypothetical protein
MRCAILLLTPKNRKILTPKEELKEMKVMKEMMTHVEVKELLANNNDTRIILDHCFNY